MLRITWFFQLLLLIFENSHGQINCGQNYYLQPGQTINIRQPGAPRNYAGANSCRWTFSSNTRIKVTCDTFYIPPDRTNQCSLDNLKVYPDPSGTPRRYCGTGEFSVESVGSQIVLTLDTVYDTPGGYFSCNFQTVTAPQCNCGLKNPKRIVGGTETGVNEFPMMAGLINLKIEQLFCGATIISNYHVILTAHCLTKLAANDVAIMVGDHNISTGEDTAASRLYRASRIDVHPSYSPPNRDYDIAIITVIGSIVFTNEVGPVCLPFIHYRDSFSGAYVDVLGWGTLQFGGPTSDTLQRAQLSVTSEAYCNSIFPEVNFRQICTYASQRDTCQFDSGGPVLWQDPTTRRYTLIGLISYGTFCGSGSPSVNTRVGPFMDWIISVTRGVQYCQVE